jgi:hypothetical protein
MFKSYSEHSEPLFNEAKILNIEKINDFLISLFMFQKGTHGKKVET